MLAKCVCSAACCGSASPSTMCQWHHSMDTSTSVMGPKIWTFPSCYKDIFDLFQLSNSCFSVHIAPQNQNVLYLTYGKTFCLSCPKTNKLKIYSHSVHTVFVQLSSRAQKLQSKHKLRGTANRHILFAHLCFFEYTQSTSHLHWKCNTDPVVVHIKLTVSWLQRLFENKQRQNGWLWVWPDMIH